MPTTACISEMEFVQEALASLSTCVVRAEHYLRTWFVPAFNHWYCPAVRRGYRGTMATVFDLGLIVIQPGVSLPPRQKRPREQHEYLRLLRRVQTSPLIKLAQGIIKEAPDRARPDVEWILVESVLRALVGVWNAKAESPQPPAVLPWVEAVDHRRTVSVCRVGGNELGRLPLGIPASARESVVWPQVDGAFSATELPDRLRVFMALVACRSSEAVHRLDYEVVEACLQGPNLQTLQHEPPPQHRTELETRTRSNVPGPIAGVTRAEVKQPEDHIIDALPSELALLMVNRDAGFAYLLNGKPLVFKHENQQDLVPKHRALVCFVVSAGGLLPQPFHARVHAYRHAYVFAKRQLFDLVRDLREALHAIRALASVEIDVAVFALREQAENAVVHRLFSLDDLETRRSGHVLQDRLNQLMSFNRLAPEFFERLSLTDGRSLLGESGAVVQGLVDPHLGRFLRRQVRQSRPYHAYHLVMIGSMNELAGFITVASHSYGFEAAARQRLTLIAVDPNLPSDDERLVPNGEPAWHCGQARTLSEAARLLGGGGLPLISLEKLRRQFVSTVIGEVRGRTGGMQRLVQMDLHSIDSEDA